MGQLMDDIISTSNNFVNNMKALSFDEEVFDFSIESLKAVDELLDDYSKYDLDEDSIYNLSSLVGCYVFETARKNYGGTYYWLKEEQQPILVAGEPDFSVSIRAWEKVRGRLLNGNEDNIPFYIEGYKEHIEKGETIKGYVAAIV